MHVLQVFCMMSFMHLTLICFLRDTIIECYIFDGTVLFFNTGEFT